MIVHDPENIFVAPIFPKISLDKATLVSYSSISKISRSFPAIPSSAEEVDDRLYKVIQQDTVIERSNPPIDITSSDDGYTLIIKPEMTAYHIIANTFAYVYTALELYEVAKVVFINPKNTDSRNIADIQYDFLLRDLASFGIAVEEYSNIDARSTFLANKIIVPTDNNNGMIQGLVRPVVSRFEKLKPTSRGNYKKVYLSRKATNPGPKTGHEDPLSRFVDDTRIYDEPILEEYLSSLGYEIVIPESFKTFEEQIDYFSNVSCMISSTSAALTNMLMMPNGGTVIELKTPLIRKVYKRDGRLANYLDETHDLYVPLSYIKKHAYLSFPVDDRLADSAVKSLKDFGEWRL